MKNIILALGALGFFSLMTISLKGQNSNCENQFAGTIDLGIFENQDTIFLNFGDTLFIEHNGDADLSGDANTNTTPGVGYAFYDCPATVDGPNLEAIISDDCVSSDPTPAGGVFVSPGDNFEGDFAMINNGAIQYFFNDGLAVFKCFVPITYDDFDGADIFYEGPDPCVHANIEESFCVMFLSDTTATSTKEIIVINQNFQVFPNPSVDRFYFNKDIDMNLAQLICTNVFGENIPINYSITGDKIMIELLVEDNGVYFLNIPGNQRNYTSKILKN